MKNSNNNLNELRIRMFGETLHQAFTKSQREQPVNRFFSRPQHNRKAALAFLTHLTSRVISIVEELCWIVTFLIEEVINICCAFFSTFSLS